MYVNNEYFQDLESMWIEVLQDPYVNYHGVPFTGDSLYFEKYNVF